MNANEKNPKGQVHQDRKNDPKQDPKKNELPDEHGRQVKDVQKAPFQQGDSQQSGEGQGGGIKNQQQPEPKNDHELNIEKYKGAKSDKPGEEAEEDDETEY